MNFFKFFPTVPYAFQANSGTFALNITNPTVHIKIQERLKEVVSIYYDYVVQEGERPDTVSTKLYGGPEYTWVILLVNTIFSLYDWPLGSEEFNAFIEDKYGSVTTAMATTLFKTAAGYFVDEVTYNTLDADNRDTISAYDWELQKNEDKRRIKVIPTAFLGPLTTELKKILA